MLTTLLLTTTSEATMPDGKSIFLNLNLKYEKKTFKGSKRKGNEHGKGEDNT